MARTRRTSVIWPIFLPILCLSLVGLVVVYYMTSAQLERQSDRLLAARAAVLADALHYHLISGSDAADLERPINAQAEIEDVALAAYIEQAEEPLIRYSSTGEWDGSELRALKPSSLRKQIEATLKNTQSATHADPKHALYYHTLPTQYFDTAAKTTRHGAIVIALNTAPLMVIMKDEERRVIVPVALIAMLLPALLISLLQGMLRSPLRAMQEVVEDRISGHTHAFMEINRRDEFGQLADSLNQLFERQKELDKGMRYSSDLVQTVIDNVPGIIFWKDRNLVYLGCNQAFSGVADDNQIDHIIGHKDAELKLTPELAELYARHDEAVMQKNASIVQEEFMLMPDGNARWIEMHKIPLRDDRKRVIGVLGLCFDITQRKHVEQEFEQTGKFNKLLFELATRTRLSKGITRDMALSKICSTIARSGNTDRVSIWKLNDTRTQIQLLLVEGRAAADIRPGVSYALAEHHAYYDPILALRPVIAHNSHSDPLASLFINSRLSKYDKHAMIEAPIVVGGEVWGSLCLEKFRHHSWNMQEEQFARSLTDIIALTITNDHYAEMSDKTRDQKDFLELIMEATTDGIWDWRIKDQTCVFSPRWKSMLGYAEEDIADNADSFYALVHPDDRDTVKQAVIGYLSHQQDDYEVAFRMRTKDNAYRWILSRGKSSFDTNGNPVRFVGTHTDITDLKRAEEQVFRQKYLLDKIIDNLPVGMFAKDIHDDFRYTIWNRQMERIFDRPCRQMLGFNDRDLFEKKEADYRRFTDEQLLETDAPVEIYEEIQSEWGRPISVNIKKFALFDQEHQPEMIIGIVDDISDLMEAQRELEEHRYHLESMVEEQTRDLIVAKEEAEKANQAKSDFLANMSHELRTPMHAIISYSQLGVDKSAEADGEKLQKYFGNINRSGKRLLHLLNDLLDLSKMEAGQLEYVFASYDMVYTITNIREEVKALLDQKSIALDMEIQTQDTTAWYDEHRIMQVLMNLLSNAIKFSTESKTIRILLKDDLLNEAYGALPALAIAIIDEGVGIPENELQEIFDKFSQSSRTKTGAGGTGLGLSISRQIISAHHGTIWAENNSDGGAKFTVVLPRKNPTMG